MEEVKTCSVDMFLYQDLVHHLVGGVTDNHASNRNRLVKQLLDIEGSRVFEEVLRMATYKCLVANFTSDTELLDIVARKFVLRADASEAFDQIMAQAAKSGLFTMGRLDKVRGIFEKAKSDVSPAVVESPSRGESSLPNASAAPGIRAERYDVI